MIARSCCIFSFLIFTGPALAQPAIQEGALLFSRISRNMAEHLKNVPNYTCQQTVERFQQAPNAQRESLTDVVRLEVAFVGGKELFAWPGSASFDDQDVRKIVSTGAFGTGDFALQTRGVFLAEGVQFQYLGEEQWNNRVAYKFSYSKPLFRSGYQISNRASGQSAEVAYQGYFWIEKASLDVMRLTVEAIDIPIVIRVASAHVTLDYGRVPMSGQTALLPQRSELRMVDDKGNVSINRMRLTRCKLFQGESTISFEDPSASEASAAVAKQRIVLPANLEVEMALSSELNFGEVAVGDPLEARLRSDLRSGKEILFPKGSVLRGRILELTKHHSPECFTVSFSMEEVESATHIAALRLRFLRSEPYSQPPLLKDAKGRVFYEYPIPAHGGFNWFKSQLRLPRGFVTIWETQAIKP